MFFEILTQVEEGPHCLNPFLKPSPHKTSVRLLPWFPHLLRTLCNKYNSITLSTWNHHDPIFQMKLRLRVETSCFMTPWQRCLAQ